MNGVNKIEKISALSPEVRKSSLIFGVFLLLNLIFVSNVTEVYSQDPSQPYNYMGNNQYTNYMPNSTVFKQEIARLEINVMRDGKGQMPIAQVPRLEKNDVLRVRLLDEAVNGIKPDQSNWEWTLLITYVNPSRNNDSEKSLSEEIQFKKTGWYKEYSFVVPYDSQPIFFLYPKPGYRDKILGLINKNKDEIRKVGEKTIEIANAYAKIGSFLNELQFVLNRSSYGYGYGSSYYNSNSSTTNYGTTYNSYGTYDQNYTVAGTTTKTSTFNKALFMEQSIERLARSFNIQMPGCWMNGSYYGGSYNNYGSNGYNNGYNSGYNNGYNSGYGNTGYYGNYMGNDFVGKVQCLAKSVRLEDLDFSIGKMLQQGGIMVAQQLSQKYPEISYWINIAAIAIDFILKVTQKTPLKLVPTVITTNGNQDGIVNPSPYTGNSFSPGTNAYSQPTVTQANDPVKISLFAEAAPMSDGFVTAYPIVIQKWQANPDSTVINLPIPILMESCLHPGSNILRSTDLLNDWMADAFTKDFKLVMSSSSGFRKVLPLKKNIGFNGWELNLSKEDIESFPKINMMLNAVVTGKRGFNEINSPNFVLPSPATGSWEISPESQQVFAVGARRTVTIRNSMNNCKCLQAVVYKPSFGGQFVFEAENSENGLRFSDDSKEVSFDIDVSNFQSGDGILELRQQGGEVTALNLKLHSALPNISDFRVAKGDSRFAVSGDKLEQIRALIINGYRAVPAKNTVQNAKNTSDKEFVFEDPNNQILSNTVSLDIELQDDRVFHYPTTFEVSIARPLIVSNKAKEVQGVVVNNSQGVYKSAGDEKTKNSNSANRKAKTETVAEKTPEFPAGASEVTVNVINALTDYDFQAENIQIETRIEDNQPVSVELPKANYHVLDWKNIQVSFLITKPFKEVLGERKLQFRIKDKIRGNSDWYTIRNSSAPNGENDSVYISNQTMENKKEVSKNIEPLQSAVETKAVEAKQNTSIPEVQSTSKTENAAVAAVAELNVTNTSKAVDQKSEDLPNQTVAQFYTITALDFYAKKDYKNAYEWFYKAVIAEPKNALYHYNLGSVLTALRDFSSAEKEMLEATKLDPENLTYKTGLEAARQNIKYFKE